MVLLVGTPRFTEASTGMTVMKPMQKNEKTSTVAMQRRTTGSWRT